jgi:energy-converting hydrogenase Eha subunit C
MQKVTSFLIMGIVLILVGGAAYILVQQPFTDCPSFMGLAVGAIPRDILDKCQISGAVQIIGSLFFIVGIGFTIYGSVTKYSS